MDSAWVSGIGGVLSAIAAVLTAVQVVRLEAGKLRRIERLTDLALKLEEGSAARLQVDELRDRLVLRFVGQRSDVRRQSMAWALWALAFLVIGTLLAFATFFVPGVAPAAPWVPWVGVLFSFAGLISISHASKMIDRDNAARDANATAAVAQD